MKQQIKDISVAYFIIETILNKKSKIHNQKYPYRITFLEDVLNHHPCMPYSVNTMGSRMQNRIFFIHEIVWLLETLDIKLDIRIIDKRHPMVTTFVNNYRQDVFTRVNLCRLINGWTYQDIRNLSNNSRLDIGSLLYLDAEAELRKGLQKEYQYDRRYNRIQALAFDDFIESYFGGYLDTAYFVEITDTSNYHLSSDDEDRRKEELLYKISNLIEENKDAIQKSRLAFDELIHKTKKFRKIKT